MENSHKALTPLNMKEHLTVTQSPQMAKEKRNYLQVTGGFHYLQILGSVLYATQMRPDIQHMVGVLM